MDDNYKIGPFIPQNSDGCTVLSWCYIKLTGKSLSFCQCCINHDEDYWYGGTKEQRKASDERLRDCIYARHNGTTIQKLLYYVISRIIWIGVRIGGSPKLPFSWRWRFGSPYDSRSIFRGYRDDDVK